MSATGFAGEGAEWGRHIVDSLRAHSAPAADDATARLLREGGPW